MEQRVVTKCPVLVVYTLVRARRVVQALSRVGRVASRRRINKNNTFYVSFVQSRGRTGVSRRRPGRPNFKGLEI